MGPRTYEQLLLEVEGLRKEKAELFALVSAIRGGEDKWYLMLCELTRAVKADIDSSETAMTMKKTHELLKAWTP